ncbi:unnamed protein product [Euphydryas editha]|uniref:Uncharacterized protein n=1 Tax=Euphydryas editha TaxID=104508 RepID=A0AAU9TGC5_EUPED|nr:unnamed protein product [Euphydryas editha]
MRITIEEFEEMWLIRVDVNSIWILSVFFFKILKPVNLQFGMPMYASPLLSQSAPMFPPPQPPPMPIMPPALVRIAVPLSSEEKTTTTVKPKEKTFRMVFPAFPAINFKESKLKKKPLFIPPIVAPQSFVLVPPAIPRPISPRRRPRKKLVPVYSSESTDSSSSSECYTARRYRRRRRPNIYRRKLRSSENDNELLKPMLSYVADDGDVKFETKISNDDVAQLLGKENKVNNRVQTVKVFKNEDEINKPQIIVVSRDEESSGHTFGRHKQVILRGGLSNHVLSEGKKELIFKPPIDKKISNISVSFQIS